MDNQNGLVKKSRGKATTLTAVIAIAAILCVVLAPLGAYADHFISHYSMYLKIPSSAISLILPNIIVTQTQWFLCSLFLPVCLVLLIHNAKKSLWAKLFLIITLLMLVIQWICAVASPIVSKVELGSFLNLITRILSLVPGRNLLFDVSLYFESIIVGSFAVRPTYLIASFIELLSNLLYILSTLLSATGFAILSFTKNKK